MSERRSHSSSEPQAFAALATQLGRLADTLSLVGDLATDQLAVSATRGDRCVAVRWRNDRDARNEKLERIREHTALIQQATFAAEIQDEKE